VTLTSHRSCSERSRLHSQSNLLRVQRTLHARGALFPGAHVCSHVAMHVVRVAVQSFTPMGDVHTVRRSLDGSADVCAAKDENFTRKAVNQSFASTACARCSKAASSPGISATSTWRRPSRNWSPFSISDRPAPASCSGRTIRTSATRAPPTWVTQGN